MYRFQLTSLFYISSYILCIFLSFHFLKSLLYLFMGDTHRERQRQAEGEAGAMQGARRGTRSWVSRIRPWAEGGAKLLSHANGTICFMKVERLRPRGRVCTLLGYFGSSLSLWHHQSAPRPPPWAAQPVPSFPDRRTETSPGLACTCSRGRGADMSSHGDPGPPFPSLLGPWHALLGTLAEPQ